MEGANPYKGQYIQWSGFEHQHEERSSDWFYALGIIAISAALTSILFGNFLFGLVILIAAGTLGILATKKPEVVDFVLTDKGLTVGDTFYEYKDIRAFWIVEEAGEDATLLIDTLKFMAPHLVIPVEGAYADEIRNMMGEFAQEEELTEPISHKILELLGF